MLSAAFAAWLYLAWPIEYLYDDGAIVLKYMDNFAAGGFYQYNLADDAVFGVSGFLHGVFAGFLSATHATTPDQSVLVSNAVGVWLTSLAVLLILRRFTSSLITILAAWVFSLSASNHFIQTAFHGLETPLHLGIVLLACWAWLSGYSRSMWLLSALAIVSKLDAVVVVGVLAALRLLPLILRRDTRADGFAELRTALLWMGIPLVLWVALTLWLFGSPFPQSAYAKLYLHSHPPGRFAFVSRWWGGETERTVIYILIAVVAMVTGLRKRDGQRDRSAVLALLGGCAALLVLYTWFNPAEHMPWYDVLPQTLLVLGAVISLLALERRSTRLPRAFGFLLPVLLLAVMVPSNVSRAVGMVRQARGYIHASEPERIAVGKYVHDHADPADRLFTGHGHIARFARIYTYDYSGLNSPLITRLYRQNKSAIRELGPEWVTRPGLMHAVAQRDLAYELVRTFYSRSLRGVQAWRIWHKREGAAGRFVARPVVTAEVTSDGSVRDIGGGLLHIRGGSQVTLAVAMDGAAEQLRFGVARQERPLDLQVSLLGVGGVDEPRPLTRVTIPAADPGDPVEGLTHEIRITLPAVTRPGSPVHLLIAPVETATIPPEFLLLEPVWMTAVIDEAAVPPRADGS